MLFLAGFSAQAETVFTGSIHILGDDSNVKHIDLTGTSVKLSELEVGEALQLSFDVRYSTKDNLPINTQYSGLSFGLLSSDTSIVYGWTNTLYHYELTVAYEEDSSYTLIFSNGVDEPWSVFFLGASDISANASITRIGLRQYGALGLEGGTDIANLTLSIIPEPSTALLLTVGAALLLGTFIVKRQRNRHHETKLILLTGMCAALVTTASAATVVNGLLINDSFTDASVSGNDNARVVTVGSGTYLSINQGPAQGTTLVSGYPNVLASSYYGHNTLQFGNNTATIYRAFDSSVASFSLNDLAIGQGLSINMSMVFGNSSGLTLSNTALFDFGFLSFSNDAVENDYSIVYAETHLSGGNSTLRYRTDRPYMSKTGSLVGQSKSWSEEGHLFTTYNEAATTVYDFSFTITKTATSNFLFEYVCSNGSQYSINTSLNTNMSNAAITGIGLRASDSVFGASALIDYITVSVIPEPGTVALLGVGALTLTVALLRRRG
ncbi:MAG: PEP-CTERM sorting domain-containing protein [Verrucomicrobiales bacterium]|nr:PEP-CTERM sorting domain-containing protein [Verrucomicrobiales bacterium]